MVAMIENEEGRDLTWKFIGQQNSIFIMNHR